ncbi:hypothetical protein BDQ17DRAFT_1422972 [Cyathus striatus]|nr:hypothetical protein BDQ17DRAFT_1422972 [Cyathus striatus]
MTLRQASNIKISQLHTAKRIRKPTARPTHKQLPAGTEELFKKAVMPQLHDCMGVAKPWTSLNEDVAATTWNSAVVDHPICPDGKNGNQDLFKFVYRLMCHDIQNNWLHGLADAGLKAVQDELEEHELITQEERAEFMQSLIGDTGMIHQKDHPFMWQSTYTGEA